MTKSVNCHIITLIGGGCVAVMKITISLQPELFDEFVLYASRTGVSISGFVQAKMKEFIAEEKIMRELIQSNKGKGRS
jgi:hypothetical protein